MQSKVKTGEAKKKVELITFLESQENFGHGVFTALSNFKRLIETKIL